MTIGNWVSDPLEMNSGVCVFFPMSFPWFLKGNVEPLPFSKKHKRFCYSIDILSDQVEAYNSKRIDGSRALILIRTSNIK